ncbi:MAG: hypothetical protein KDA47_08145, partial [Planctomycetales bacterium]|nr:hypothetical protein [Planctomycetales bacterium]
MNILMMRSEAAWTSDSVWKAPRLNRIAPSTIGWGSPIANNTGEGSLEPLAQADPVEVRRVLAEGLFRP